VTISLDERGVGAILLDIEGTTTPIAFVHEVLFPYAAARLDAFLTAHDGEREVTDILTDLEGERRVDRDATAPTWAFGGPHRRDSAIGYLQWLMQRDRKSPALKRLQGLIWEAGYQSGELRGQVFADVAGALRRWHAAGRRLAIYSSGSELAQRRLFESTPSGDLTLLFDGFFDTRVGAKMSDRSYRRIADDLAASSASILFVSDVTAELSAAKTAGLQVVLSVRPGNAVQPNAAEFESIASFDEID
jgi:enolase-phosphatase E1